MHILQKLGLALFCIALLIFTASLGLNSYQLTADSLRVSSDIHHETIMSVVEENGLLNQTFASSFSFAPALKQGILDAQVRLEKRFDQNGLPVGVTDEWAYKIGDWTVKDYVLQTTKASSIGPVTDAPIMFWLLTIGLGVLGGLVYILPAFGVIPGIKHDHIYHGSMTRGLRVGVRGFLLGLMVFGILVFGVYYMGRDYLWSVMTALLGILIIVLVFFVNRRNREGARSASPDITGWLGVGTGLYLIGFYILLYWSPEHITSWMIMSDPLSLSLSGNAASQWFVYGTLYTVIMLVMGVRMATKYLHNRYQLIRTGSVVFFQTAFAFLLPEILVRLNYPYFDFKNIWPLNYTFFFDYNINTLMSSGGLGVFMLFWGIILVLVVVPLITYFYGKRWYCSWVCGCGGLAETFGDPYRQLSDKSLVAWEYERWIIHAVLVFAVVMTIGVLYSFLPYSGAVFTKRVFLGLMILLLLGSMSFAYLRWKRGKVDISVVGIRVGWIVTGGLIAISAYHLVVGDGQFLFMDSGSTRQWYGFLIGSAFAGVVGTGFYPLMGNRVWCRFGCPLAAYLGLVQRFKSRFRITTNGGQCISCGNCSTYCEMGIDVRHYAQRGQDIVRSSCVGCGVCSAVCPRGVLRLENSSIDIDVRTNDIRVLHVSKDGVSVYM